MFLGGHISDRLPSIQEGWVLFKGETIHRMHRNRDYFGDGSVHNTYTNDMMLKFIDRDHLSLITLGV
jgi:hypothetical protein